MNPNKVGMPIGRGQMGRVVTDTTLTSKRTKRAARKRDALAEGILWEREGRRTVTVADAQAERTRRKAARTLNPES